MNHLLTCNLFELLTGELYVQAQRMFDDNLYQQLLAVIDSAVKQAIIGNDNCDTEFVSEISTCASCLTLVFSPMFELFI